MKTWLVTLALFSLAMGAPRAEGQSKPLPGKGAVAKTTTEAAKVQVILMGYTRKDGIGRACQKDIHAVKKMLLDAFDTADRRPRLQIHDLTGDLWSGPQILDYLQKLQVGRKDVVLVYHSGHGGEMIAAKPEDSHMLNLNRGGLPRSRLRQVLLTKQPQGLIILTDCCSTWKGIRPVALEDEGKPRSKPNWATLRNLLLRTPKLVNITAAEDGRMAQAAHLAHKGTGAESAFTVALLSLLHSPREFQSWGELYPHLKQYTREASGGTHQPRFFQMAEVNAPTPPPAPPPTLVNRPLPDPDRFNHLAGRITRPTSAQPLVNRPTPDPLRFNRIQ